MTPAHLDPHAVIETPRQRRIEFLREHVGHIFVRHDVSIVIVRSASRSHGLTQIRVEIARALREKGLSYKAIGRYLNRDDRTVTEYIKTGGRYK